jgi:hypothetical protein
MAGGVLRSVFGLESYAPRIRFRRNTRHGPAWFVEALFPGYPFARFNYAEEHRKVRHAAGVAGFFQFGERIAAVEEESMGVLHSLVGESGCMTVDPEPRFGEWVCGQQAMNGWQWLMGALEALEGALDGDTRGWVGSSFWESFKGRRSRVGMWGKGSGAASEFLVG